MAARHEGRLERRHEGRQEPLAPEFRQLLDVYPRDSWEAHPNFRQATENWLSAHDMFRRLSRIVRLDAEAWLDGRTTAQDYARRLSQRGNALVGNLHGHHGWEDHVYFPELSAADPRFDRGLAVLEQDHEVLDRVLHSFADKAIATLDRHTADRALDDSAVGQIHDTVSGIENLLARHLADEEELAVPIILHHNLRG